MKFQYIVIEHSQSQGVISFNIPICELSSVIMWKIPTISLSSYGNVLYCCATYHNPFVTACGQNQSLNPPLRSFGRGKPQHREYAECTPKKSPSDQLENLHWPELSSSTAIPTPYQIFQLGKDAPYSKRRFYELVKLYHPDRYFRENCSSDPHSVLFDVRVERYRLVVAANDILSDPTKRMAYDKYGAGWDGCPDSDMPKYGWGPYNDTKWSGFDANSSPARNATWEDWEKWYKRDTNHKEPRYFSNRDFLYLTFIFIALGGIGQVSGLRGQSRSASERVEAVHNSCIKNIRSRRKSSHEYQNRDERVQNFLGTRDPSRNNTNEKL